MAAKIEIRRKSATTYEVQSSRDPNLWHHTEINPETRAGICSCPGDGSIQRAGTGNQCRHVKAVFKMVTKEAKENGDAPATALAKIEPAHLVERRSDIPPREEMRGMMELSNFLVGGAMLPKGITKAQDVMMILMYGRAVGIDPMTATQKLFVVDGKIGMYAELMLAIAKANEPTLEARFEWSDADGGSCTCDLWRRGKSVQKVTYTGAMADRSGQGKKSGPWQTYRRDMLAWNACKRALRLGAPDLYLAVQPRGGAAAVDAFEGEIIEGSAIVIDAEADALPLPASAGATAAPSPPVAPVTGTLRSTPEHEGVTLTDPGPERPAAAPEPAPTPAPAPVSAPEAETAAESARVAVQVKALRAALTQAHKMLPEGAWKALQAAMSASYEYALSEPDGSGARHFVTARLTPADLDEAIEDVERIVAEAAEPTVDPDDLPF